MGKLHTNAMTHQKSLRSLQIQDLTSAVLVGVRGTEVCVYLWLEQRLITCSLQMCLAQAWHPASPALPALRDRWYLGELGYTRHDRFYNQKGSYGTLLLRTKVP